jgi:hypothetical protein
MAEAELQKRDIAIRQLEAALSMFLGGGDMVCVLTLAGAAEEILGKELLSTGGHTALSTLQAATAAVGRALGHEPATAKAVADIANRARNAVKHLNAAEGPTVWIDAEEAAADMLDRAITNYFGLTGDQSAQMGEFLRRRYPGV